MGGTSRTIRMLFSYFRPADLENNIFRYVWKGAENAMNDISNEISSFVRDILRIIFYLPYVPNIPKNDIETKAPFMNSRLITYDAIPLEGNYLRQFTV